MKLLIGLGNPGKKYEHTRHNLGFLALEFLRKRYEGFDWEESRFHGVISKTKGDISFFKPLTFMNLSGDAIAAFVNYYKLQPKNDILILSDDLDMEFGKVRYRESGSHGGQNGLRDTIAKLGTDAFSRIKIGMGRDETYNVSDWVLSNLKKEELLALEQEVFPRVDEYVQVWLKNN